MKSPVRRSLMRMMLALLLAAGFCLAAGQNATAAAGRQPAAQAPGRPTDRTRAPTSGASYYLYQEVDLSAYAAAIDAGSAKINATGWLVNNECVQSWEDRNYMQVLLYDGDDSPIDSYDTGEISQHGSWEQHGLTNYTIPTGARLLKACPFNMSAGTQKPTVAATPPRSARPRPCRKRCGRPATGASGI